MAPEVTRCKPYNEKADVFSFGIVLYQLFARQTFAAVLLLLSRGDPVDCEIYAEKVARGYRVPIPARWPEAVRELVAQCWAQDPADRPSMDDVARMLVSAEGGRHGGGMGHGVGDGHGPRALSSPSPPAHPLPPTPTPARPTCGTRARLRRGTRRGSRRSRTRGAGRAAA